MRGTRSHSAVAATQRSASCSFWPKPCPVRTHHVRSDTYASTRCGPGQTISARAISYSSRPSFPGPQPASFAPYSSSATVTKEMTAGRPSRSARYRPASKLPLGVRRASEHSGVDDGRTPDGRGHASSTAATKRRSSSSVRSSMRTSSSGGRGCAAARTSSLLRSRLGPRGSGLRASCSDIATSIQLPEYLPPPTGLMLLCVWRRDAVHLNVEAVVGHD